MEDPAEVYDREIASKEAQAEKEGLKFCEFCQTWTWPEGEADDTCSECEELYDLPESVKKQAS